MDRERTVRKQPQDFSWTSFYEAVARKLLEKREHRQELAAGLCEAVAQVHGIGNKYLHVESEEGTTEPIRDIDPFTFLSAFNRRTSFENRRKVANEIAALLGVDIEAPVSFEGIPTAYNSGRDGRFFDYSALERYGEIGVLWDFFLWADRFASADESETRRVFAANFDAAMKAQYMTFSLTYGLFWSHPWIFPPLSPRPHVKQFVESNFNAKISPRLTGPLYLDIHDALHEGLANETVSVHSVPDFALKAFRRPQSNL